MVPIQTLNTFVRKGYIHPAAQADNRNIYSARNLLMAKILHHLKKLRKSEAYIAYIAEELENHPMDSLTKLRLGPKCLEFTYTNGRVEFEGMGMVNIIIEIQRLH